MSKVNTLFMVSLLFFMVSMAAARPPAEFYDVTHMETHPEDIKDSGIGRVSVERNCEGDGQEECLMRRTLAAQTDYIYTQKHN